MADRQHSNMPRQSLRRNKGLPPERYSPNGSQYNLPSFNAGAQNKRIESTMSSFTNSTPKITEISSTSFDVIDSDDDNVTIIPVDSNSKRSHTPLTNKCQEMDDRYDDQRSQNSNIQPSFNDTKSSNSQYIKELEEKLTILRLQEEILYKETMLREHSTQRKISLPTTSALSKNSNTHVQNKMTCEDDNSTSSCEFTTSNRDKQFKVNPKVTFESSQGEINQFSAHGSHQHQSKNSEAGTVKPDAIQVLAEALKNILDTNKDNNKANHQFITRQTIGKDLPFFDGSPEDFPLFYEQFKKTTELGKFSDDENMERLRRCLRGAAKEAVKSFLVYPENLSTVIDMLQFRFGRPEHIIKSLIAKTTALPNVKEDRPSTIIEFATAVINLTVTVVNLDREDYLRNPQLITQIESKMSPVLQMMWTNHVQAQQADWFSMQSRAAMIRSDWTDNTKPETKKFRGKINNVSHTYQNQTTTPGVQKQNRAAQYGSRKPNQPLNCKVCKGSCKVLTECQKFLNFDVEEKWRTVSSNRLCFACLKSGHDLHGCTDRKSCGIEGCQRPHNPVLHKSLPPDTAHTIRTNLLTGKTTKLKIIPVVLQNGNKEVKCHALLDPGATISIVNANIVNQLELDGPTVPVCVTWANGQTHHEPKSKQVKFNIRGDFDKAKTFQMTNVKTMSRMCLPRQSLNKEKIIDKYKFLEHIPFQGYENVSPEILIGEDHAILISGRNVIHKENESPIATRTWLGWTVSGNDMSAINNPTNFIFTMCDDDKLHNLVKQFFETDNFGVQLKHDQPKSKEDERALKLLETTTKKLGDRWETGLLWKSENVFLPESKSMAEHRLKCLEKRLDRDNNLKTRYCDKIQHYLNSGYLKEVNEKDLNSTRLWFLPHFPIINKKKPEKVRIVFDAAAKLHGYSLNDFLVQGPDFLKPLTNILFHFRKHQIGFTGDIREMYHQIKITPDDAASQLILWRGNDRNTDPKVYQMTVMTFGATCSPSSAIYVKDKNAKELASQYPAASEVIQENHYMDDYLDSTDTVDEAVQKIFDVIHVHHVGGFEIINFICSSNSVIEQIPSKYRQQNQDVLLGGDDEFERILGVWWQPKQDALTFKINFDKVSGDILTGSTAPTKRDILKLVMSIFDPLGMAANLVIKGKILLQNIWRTGILWDDILPENILCQWMIFIQELNKLTCLRLPRCYSPLYSSAKEIQLHVFCDVSKEAFAAVCYFRVISTDDNIDVCFVVAKARVAPLKSLTVPRLELQAAVMDTKRYKTFVANRVGEISELTNASDWHWIPTAENVADEATRSSGEINFDNNSRWINGPRFLKNPISEWPDFSTPEMTIDDDEEINRIYLLTTTKIHSLPDIDKFSNYQSLLRSTSYVCRFINICRKRNEHEDRNQCADFCFTSSEIRQAEKYLLKRAQSEDFNNDIVNLMKGRPIESTSKLYKLNVKLIDGLVRLDGRLNYYDCNLGVRNPIILDGKNQLSQLLISHFHRKYHHTGNATVLNELRQSYWILRAKPILQRIKRACMICQLKRAQPTNQLMGQIPDIRLKANLMPFWCTGVDFFGPLEVKHGRKIEKRYGVLFTCMTVRAVHVEIASDLTTDACLMAVRRFIDRRGYPMKIISDNGTNFRGASKEIIKAIEDLDRSKIIHEMTTRGITWIFNPPSAPHMGGCWERLVRSIKEALYITLKEVHPTEEVLYTLLVEAEQIVNSRPLTEVSLDYEDDEALTPNHFLLCRSSGKNQLDPLIDRDMPLRKRFQIAQQLTSTFWKRWMKEFLPTLARRIKWTKEQRQIRVGDVVIIADSNHPRCVWPKGVVTAVYPGRDGFVRVADVKTATGVSRRPTTKLCLLDIGLATSPKTVGGNVPASSDTEN